MLKKIYYKYIVAVLVGATFSHLVISYLLGITTSYFYDNYLINVRNFNDSEYRGLSNAYLTEKIQAAKKPILLILGSSFSYGYGLPAENTYTNYLTKNFQNYFIMNASVIGDSGSLIFDKINYLKSKKIKVDTLIIEINLFNFTSTKQYSTKYSTKENKLSIIDSLSNSFFNFYLLHPHGINLVANLDLNRLYIIGKAPENKYAFAPLPDSYSQKYSAFKKNLPNYRMFLETLLSSSKEVADNVYFFVSPIYKNGIMQSQFELADIERELSDLNDICKKIPKTHCLNPGLKFSEDNFMNLSHFNQNGHVTLAKWLSKQLTNEAQV